MIYHHENCAWKPWTSLLCGVFTLIAIGAGVLRAEAPTDNPIASYYGDAKGWPGWTDDIAWDNVITMEDKGDGDANFADFEAKRDELHSAGGGILYYPSGTWDFAVPGGPNGRGLMLKPGVVIRGVTPSSGNNAVVDYDTHGLNSLTTVFRFRTKDGGHHSLQNFIGCTPADAEGVGIAWVQLDRAYIHMGFDATKWAGSWGQADDWLTAQVVSGWKGRVPDGTHIMDAWAGDGTTGKYDSGEAIYGSKRFVFGCRLNDAYINNYVINKEGCGTFSEDEESWRFGAVISLYGSHVLVANNVVPSTGNGKRDNRAVIDINKSLIAFYTNRCNAQNHTGLYAEEVVVRDNWVYNKGNKSYEISGTWVTVRDNIANKDYRTHMTILSCHTSDGASDYMNRGIDMAGWNVWVHNNEVRGTGSAGNDGEGILVQRHNEVEVFSHAYTYNEAARASQQTQPDKGYIASYDTHVLGLLAFQNWSNGNVGIRKPASNTNRDVAIVKNTAEGGVVGTEVNDCLSSCSGLSVQTPSDVEVSILERGNKISWSDRTSGEIGYRIERKNTTGTVETIAYRPRQSQGSAGFTYNPNGSGGGGPCDCEHETGFDLNPTAWVDYLAPGNTSVSYRVVAIDCRDNDAASSDWVPVEHTTRNRHSRSLQAIGGTNRSPESTTAFDFRGRRIDRNHRFETGAVRAGIVVDSDGHIRKLLMFQR